MEGALLCLPMPLDIDRIEALRKELGLTQEEAAAKANLPGRGYWNDIVSGRKANVTIEVLEKIASALGVPSKDLLK
jgi:transcriptional regulator with XRE-family HTH domain